MATRKTSKARRPGSNSVRNLKAVYSRVRREFTAADLQRYTTTEKGIPADKVLADLEQIHRKVSKG